MKKILLFLISFLTTCTFAWSGDKYYLFTPSGGGPAHTGSLSGDFICNRTPASGAQTIDGVSFSHSVAVSANTSLTAAWTTQFAGSTTIDYDLKTSSASFTVYAYNGNSTNYGVCKAEVEEGETPTSFSQIGTNFKSSGQKITFDVTTTKNKRVRIGTSSYSNVKFYQIVVEETGTPLAQPAQGTDYVLDFTGKRFAVLAKGTVSTIDGIRIVSNSDIKYNATVPKLSNGSNSHTYYISFTTSSTCHDKLVVTASGTYSLTTSVSTFAASATASGAEVELEPSTTYYIQGPNEDRTINKIEFKKPAAVCTSITPTFTTDYASTTLTVGGSNSSTPVVDKDGSSGAITWESSDEDVATVNSSGVVTPVASGSATITATIAANGDYCEGTVTKDFTVTCPTPDAPDGVTAGSTTSTGTTLTISDDAGAASYDIYYSTSSSAPSAGTAASTTSTIKTKALTGLTPSTTYYVWVRSVCDASHKSDWVALTSSTFTTLCAAPTSPSISGTTAYTEGDDISLTASATGTSASVTYTWYKGATWDAASATSSIHSGATLSINDCVEDNAGTYWCNISNGTGCDVQTSKTITVSGACTDPSLTITLN